MDIQPLGPAWDRALTAEELARRAAAEPAFAPELPEPERTARGCALYALTPLARAAVEGGAGLTRLRGSVCALGAFDGVHLGHRMLAEKTVREARELGLPAVAVTFDPDPADVLAGRERFSMLLPVVDRLRLLVSLGLDALLVVPFTRELAATGHREFLEGWLVPELGCRSLHVGSNFRMGSGGAGTVEALTAEAAELGVSVRGHELLAREGEVVSATRIRALVRAGEVGRAAELLGRDHCVRGRVVHGRGEGTSFGFPTANLSCDERSCLPGEGVYAALASVDGTAWPAAVNVGAPRTFGGEEGRAFLEPTLLGFSGDLYGRELEVSFVAWLREPRKFPSFEVLKATVLGNVEWVRRFMGESPIAPEVPVVPEAGHRAGSPVSGGRA